MIKIGLITFHRAINYGAVLQAYALQETLKEAGAKVKIIDFRSKTIEDEYRLIKKYYGPLRFRTERLITELMKIKGKIGKRKKVERFITGSLDLTESISTDLEQLNSCFDVFVTGSDQVFNTDLTVKDKYVYFLSFAEKPRYSYAASFGKDYIREEDWKWISRELGRYSRISVREESGIEIVRDVCGKQAEVNLDPTFLLSAKRWRELESRPSGCDEPFILVYNMMTSPLLYEAAEELKRITKHRVIFVNNKNERLKFLHRKFSYRDDIAPEELLWLIDHAGYILTSSFHGTVFSLLFHKKFLTVLPKGEPRIARNLSLLKMAGVEDRCILERDGINRIVNEPDWQDVEQRIENGRISSLRYINEIVHEKDK